MSALTDCFNRLLTRLFERQLAPIRYELMEVQRIMSKTSDAIAALSPVVNTAAANINTLVSAQSADQATIAAELAAGEKAKADLVTAQADLAASQASLAQLQAEDEANAAAIDALSNTLSAANANVPAPPPAPASDPAPAPEPSPAPEPPAQ